MSGSIVFAGIAPHPPLLVPEVGGDRVADVSSSQQAMREFSRRLVNTNPDTIVLISPHSPLHPKVFTTRASERLSGDFRRFGAASVHLAFSNDLEFIKQLKPAAAEEGVQLVELEQSPALNELDHGALVPLFYIAEAGWSKPIVVIGYTYQSNEKHLAAGRAIRRAADSSGKRIAVVASGDLSHRLIPEGPYDYEPTAHLFDEQIVKAIRERDSQSIVTVDTELRERAGECGYRSILVALGSLDERLTGSEVLSYEGPFGVGYLVAVLMDDTRARV